MKAAVVTSPGVVRVETIQEPNHGVVSGKACGTCEGSVITIEDPQAVELITLAKEGKQNPCPLLNVRSIFSDLARDAAFMQALEELYDIRVMATLACCLSPSDV
jgi:hypothetical protein